MLSRQWSALPSLRQWSALPSPWPGVNLPTHLPQWQAAPTNLPYPAFPTFPPAFPQTAGNNFFSTPKPPPTPIDTPTLQVTTNQVQTSKPHQSSIPPEPLQDDKKEEEEKLPKSPEAGSCSVEPKASEAQTETESETKTRENLPPETETDEISETNRKPKYLESFEEKKQTESVSNIFHGRVEGANSESKENFAGTGNDLQDSENAHLQSELFAEEERMVENAIVLFDVAIQLDDTTIGSDGTSFPTDEKTVPEIALAPNDKAVVDPDNNPRSSENNVNAEEVQDEGDDEAAKDTKTEEVQAEKDGLAGAVLV